MDKEKDWERGTRVSDIEAGSLSVELFLIRCHAATIKMHKDVLLGLV